LTCLEETISEHLQTPQVRTDTKVTREIKLALLGVHLKDNKNPPAWMHYSDGM